jgi:integrase
LTGRQGHRRSSIYKGSDGYWHGRVTVGVTDAGKPDRRHVMARSKLVVTERVRELEKKRDEGSVPAAGSRWTVATWLVHWLENIARPTIRHNSYDAYRIAVHNHLIPGVGGHRLDRLAPEHLERLYQRMIEAGARPGTAHQVHRTVRTALGEAVRRGYVQRNVAALARPPRHEVEPIEPYSLPEVQQIMVVARSGRNGARWAIALALGLRQGEVLGLKWSDVDLDRAELRVAESRQRPRYRHGCAVSCGRPAGRCPDRLRANEDRGFTKSVAGRRVIGLPEPLIDLLRTHQLNQDAERGKARQLWIEGGWVFTTAIGQPINPSTDYHAWKALLKRAGVREVRLHDARHTAATVLLVLGVPERTVMDIMGWSSTAMAARYQHVTDPIRREVASRVGTLLWASNDPR